MMLLGRVFLLVSVISPSVDCLSSTAPSLQSILSTHAPAISSLRSQFPDADNDLSDLFYLRHAIAAGGDGPVASESVRSAINWRTGRGLDICSRAAEAVSSATSGGKWTNGPAFSRAPSIDAVGRHITPDVALTTSDPAGNLIYVICAGSIDDAALMDSVSGEELVEFFLYVKEVHRLVADARSLEQDRLVKIITVNDLSGISLLSGEKRFRKALSDSSKEAASIFKELNDVTMLLNLPKLVSALVGLFKPLFPPSVRAKLRFANGPLGKSVSSLTEIAPGGLKREVFLGQLADLLAKE